MKIFGDPFGPSAPTNRFRQRRVQRVRRLVEEILQQKPNCRILDVGGWSSYWQAFAPDIVSDPRVKITLLNLEYHDPPAPAFELEFGDARQLGRYSDRSFDLVHSNSVIEHVGRWDDMRAMAAEITRVGHQYFVQTPYWGFPMEPHNRTLFFHWLPEQARYRIVMRFQLGCWQRATNVNKAMQDVQSNALLDRKQFQALFPAARIYSERFFGLTKSLIAIGGAR